MVTEKLYYLLYIFYVDIVQVSDGKEVDIAIC